MNQLNKFSCILVAFSLLFTACNKDDSNSLTSTKSELLENAQSSFRMSSDQANILLIIVDDVGKDALAGYSEGVIKPHMPNLQSLIDNGVKFQNFWTSPVCSPTRASMLTGKKPSATGILDQGLVDNNLHTSLHEFLDVQTAGTYSSALIGKWHLGSTTSRTEGPTNHGIDYFAGILNGAISDYFDWPYVENGISYNTEEYATSKLTNLAIDWIGAQTSPWFLWLAYNAGHTPFHLPPDSLHSQVGLSGNDINSNPLPYYLASIEALDHEMGRLFNSLSPSELANTIIIFMGDNGTSRSVVQSPYNRNMAKGSLFQGGINMPLVVSGKGVSRLGEEEDALINVTDIFATVAELAGLGIDEIHDSRSFAGLLSGTIDNERAYTIIENSNGYAIRGRRFKLIRTNGANDQFYNLRSDPYENNDLLEDGVLNNPQTNAYNEMISWAEDYLNN